MGVSSSFGVGFTRTLAGKIRCCLVISIRRRAGIRSLHISDLVTHLSRTPAPDRPSHFGPMAPTHEFHRDIRRSTRPVTPIRCDRIGKPSEPRAVLTWPIVDCQSSPSGPAEDLQVELGDEADRFRGVGPEDPRSRNGMSLCIRPRPRDSAKCTGVVVATLASLGAGSGLAGHRQFIFCERRGPGPRCAIIALTRRRVFVAPRRGRSASSPAQT